mgnify:CR=1 FL=1
MVTYAVEITPVNPGPLVVPEITLTVDGRESRSRAVTVDVICQRVGWRSVANRSVTDTDPTSAIRPMSLRTMSTIDTPALLPAAMTWLATAAALACAACASTPFVSSWRAPNAEPLQITGAKVAAVAMIDQIASRRATEDAIARWYDAGEVTDDRFGFPVHPDAGQEVAK